MLQFKGNFVDGQNNSKYRDCAPITEAVAFCISPSHCYARAGVCDNTGTEKMLSQSAINDFM